MLHVEAYIQMVECFAKHFQWNFIIVLFARVSCFVGHLFTKEVKVKKFVWYQMNTCTTCS